MAAGAPQFDARRVLRGFALLTAVYFFVTLVLPKPASVKPDGWLLTGIFIATMVDSIAELYGSHPGNTAALLGSFLMTGVYQSVVVGCAMFLTGQASNPLAANIASQYGYPITYASWIQATIIPGIASLLIVPWV